ASLPARAPPPGPTAAEGAPTCRGRAEGIAPSAGGRTLGAEPCPQPPGETICAMCGIIGYVGPRDSTGILLSGLQRLEYRGYDSAGVAILDRTGRLGMAKRAGKLGNLVAELAEGGLAEGT